MAVTPFENLEVFKKVYRVSLEVHRASLTFPKIEQYALGDQVRRASKSVCANIAEGFGKQSHSKAEFRRFLMMALGSADEMRVWCRYCLDLGYIDEATWKAAVPIPAERITNLIIQLDMLSVSIRAE